MGGSSSKQQTDFIVKEFPGLFGTPGGARIGGQLESLLGQGVSPPDRLQAPSFDFGAPPERATIPGLGQFDPSIQTAFTDPLQQAILDPQFGPTTGSEQAFLESINALTKGSAGVRGIQPTQAGLAQNLAPALMGLRQQQIGNLQSAQAQQQGAQLGLGGLQLGGRGQDLQQGIATGQLGAQQRAQDIGRQLGLGGLQLGAFGQDVTQRGQDITAGLGGRGQTIGGLVELAGLAMPQLIGGGVGTGKSKGISL